MSVPSPSNQRSSHTFSRLYVVLATAIGLSFLLSFSFTSSSASSSFGKLSIPVGLDLAHTEDLNKVVTAKAEELRKVVAVGKGHFKALEPLNPESVWLLFNDEAGYLNASTQNLVLRGLSHMKVEDVATNDKTSGASVSFVADRLILSGTYQIKHKRNNDYIDDQGKFSIYIDKWYTTWSGTALTSSNSSYFNVAELSIDCRPEGAKEEFSSNFFGKKISSKHKKELLEVTSVLMDKVKKQVEDRLYQATEQIAKVTPLAPKVLTGEEATQRVNEYNLKRQRRQVPCERGEELDEYVDSLFRFASRLIRAMEPFTGTIPNVTVELPEYNVIIFLHGGGATHAYTIQRKKPAWVMCTNESISLGLTVGFEELRVMFKFRVIQDWKLLFDGEMEAQINKPKVQVQFTQTTPDEDSEEQVQQRVDAIRIWSLGQIRIMLKGLGNLTQAASIFLTGFLNRNLDSLMPTIRNLENQAIGFANNALKNISIPFFSII